MQDFYAASDAVSRTVNIEDGTVTFSGMSLSGKNFTVTTSLSGANQWLNGGLIQNCLPNLTEDERELLISGIDADHWSRLWDQENK